MRDWLRFSALIILLALELVFICIGIKYSIEQDNATVIVCVMFGAIIGFYIIDLVTDRKQ